MQPIAFHVNIRIQKPVAEVFDAVVNPKKLSGYFTQTASAPLKEEGEEFWSFPEFPGEYPVTVRKVVPNERIELEWEAQEGGYNTRVVMTFKDIDPATTLVTIAESGWRDNEIGVKSSYQNCGGWMHMLCCMKAYMEHNINLRAGSFHMDDMA
jgi:uncharacterized protein YndB with AHSA1/START domain